MRQVDRVAADREKLKRFQVATPRPRLEAKLGQHLLSAKRFDSELGAEWRFYYL